jgi:predicted metal-dependent TIM-barrel fold hydrolase
MVEILRQYGAERVIVDSACDWGISEPLGVAKTAKLALQSGIAEKPSGWRAIRTRWTRMARAGR